jgi:UDP-N-acetylglucosamine 4,6-dehydratase
MTLDGKHILVTGATGSFGRAFVGRLLRDAKPARLIVFSRDELKQFEMQQQFPDSKYPCMRYFIGDVRDRERLEMAMRGVDIVVHAAAMKQVPAAEYNPFECVKTNIHGAENIVTVAIREGVERVIALSTDKAANPINLYGATKLVSDKIFTAGNNLSGTGGTRFAVVRYGNVVGSRGSVIPFWKKLITEGATRLPVTDPRMTRFWITLDQGVQFVIDGLERMRGGEIFVPKLPSMTVADLAEAMLPGVELDVVGIRPGEKLHEVMISSDDARMTVEMDDHYIIEPSFQFWDRDEVRQSGEARSVPEGFEYSSGTNDRWLTTAELREMANLDG